MGGIHTAVVTTAPFRPAALALLLGGAALLAGCSLHDKRMDLALNEQLYTYSGKSTMLQGDRSVYVSPVGRDDNVPQHASDEGYPITYESEAKWDRSPEEMVFDILREEVKRSDIFTELRDRPSADTIVVKPTIHSFTSGYKEQPDGNVAMAEFVMRIEVFGPDTGNGSRTKVMDDLFLDRQSTEAFLSPPPAQILLSTAIRNTMNRILTALDGSNVSRSGVPLEAIDR